MKRRGGLLLALTLAVTATPALAADVSAPVPVAIPASAEQWRAAAMRDVEAGYQLTRENHAGSYDTANPGFLHQLDKAREAGLALAAKVSDPAGYQAAIARFTARIGDGHAGMYTVLPAEMAPPMRWPGFITAWRGDALYVYASEADGPASGARLESCDGKPPRQLIDDNVFAFLGRADEAGNWWSNAHKVFIDVGNPFITLPQRCQFSLGGERIESTLTWRAFSDQAGLWWAESEHGDGLAVGMTSPRAGLYWMAMPTFQPDEKARDAYRAVNQEIIAHRQRYLNADAIVIDLRHNFGGSSDWSLQFAYALWGKGRVSRRMKVYAPAQEVHWRASAANVEYAAWMADTLAAQDQQRMADGVRHIAAQMRAALVRGDKYFIAGRDGAPATAEDRVVNLPSDPPAFTKPVYVIVPGQCTSACLDALDVFTRFPNTKLIGAPSGADSSYLEVRTQKLESGLSYVIIPIKFYVNRPRANGQIYEPAIYVRDLKWTTAGMLDVVEHDLAARVDQP